MSTTILPGSPFDQLAQRIITSLYIREKHPFSRPISARNAMKPYTLFTPLLVATVTEAAVPSRSLETNPSPRSDIEVRQTNQCLWCVVVELNGDRPVARILSQCVNVQHHCEDEHWFKFYVTRALSMSTQYFPEYQWKQYNLDRWTELNKLYEGPL